MPPPFPPRLALLTPHLSNTPFQAISERTKRLPTSRASSKNRQQQDMASKSIDADKVQKYDYIVIGGGSGGSGTARRASGWYGAKTLLVENGPSGGTCVNKITWNFASIAETLRDSKTYGFATPDNIPYDFTAFKKKRDAHVLKTNSNYETNWAKEGITLLRGTAAFSGPQELSIDLEDGSGIQKFSAPHICISTGGNPIVPTNIPGADLGITNEGFFALDVLPKKIAVMGAGYIAVELAGMLHAVGVEVHMFIRGTTFLRTFDPMVQSTMTKRYEDVEAIMHKGYQGFTSIESIGSSPENKILRLTSKDGEVLEVNELLWAVGRKPETDSLNLGLVGVELGKKRKCWALLKVL